MSAASFDVAIASDRRFFRISFCRSRTESVIALAPALGEATASVTPHFFGDRRNQA